MNIIERKWIVNEISLKNFFKYTNSVYQIGEEINSLERQNLNCSRKPKTKASTVGKMIFTTATLNYKSINEFKETAFNKVTNFKGLFKRNEYVPKTHGIRDCVMDTDYHQIEAINKKVISKIKNNRIFDKNKVDGLTVIAWDGGDLKETTKDIENLPEREYKDNDIRKYIKYLTAMNIGPRANIIIDTIQMTEQEKVLTESGKLKAKTFGETTALEKMWPSIKGIFGHSYFVNVMDALYLNSKVLNTINNDQQYFVVRMEDETRLIYKDAEGLFKRTKPKFEYEIVEEITQKTVVYSKTAKHKNYTKSKIRLIERDITNTKLNEKILVKEYKTEKKNSTIYNKVYERVIKTIKVWSDTFELTNYEGIVKVVKASETTLKYDKKEEKEKEVVNDIYVCTNMINHDDKLILKILHLRWNIENNGFRTLKQQFHVNHIFIGEFNAINYIFQMIILVFNLIQLYFKIRKKDKITCSYNLVKKIFELDIIRTKEIWKYLSNEN